MKFIFRGLGYTIAAILFALGIGKSNAPQAGETGPTGIAQLSTTPDLPTPFGYKSTWLAVRTENTKAVFDALGLTQEAVANWETGIGFSYSRDFGDSSTPVFVAPPIDGWTLVLTQFGLTSDSDENIATLEKLLIKLSRQFGECQYFGSYRVVDYVAWYRATDGEITRGFSFADSVLYANKGQTTLAELEAGLFDLTGLNESELWEVILEEDDEEQAYDIFDEETPMLIAERWSVNPLSLELHEGSDAATGLVGILPK